MELALPPARKSQHQRQGVVEQDQAAGPGHLHLQAFDGLVAGQAERGFYLVALNGALALQAERGAQAGGAGEREADRQHQQEGCGQDDRLDAAQEQPREQAAGAQH